MRSIDPKSVGLSSAEAARRLAQYGPNDPTPAKRHLPLLNLTLQFANPPVIILFLASAVSALVGELLNATVILVVISVSVALNFVPTFRSQKGADLLRAAVASTAWVVRNGVFATVNRVDVVPGDVVRLRAGDLAAADARQLEAKDLHVQQSTLTGESMPVEKDFQAGDETDAPPRCCSKHRS